MKFRGPIWRPPSQTPVLHEVILQGGGFVAQERVFAARRRGCRDAALRRLGVSGRYLLYAGNPKPHKGVEDLVRGVAARLADDPRLEGFVVEAENFESIHNHSAYARIARGL